MNYFGRKKIYTDIEEVTRDNVLEVLNNALTTHLQNRADILYLYNYYKGNQPILTRRKEVRPEINNKIVENRANEIISFKSGYLMGEPVSYVSRREDALKDLDVFNEEMFLNDKDSKDMELADWFHITGTAYRIVLPINGKLEFYTLDPADTFVVYHNGLGEKPVMGVKIVTKANEEVVYSCYTKNRYFEILGSLISEKAISKEEPHILGEVPIIEYPANNARLGAFEIVLPILDAINVCSSNRLDGIEQYIQALMVFKGVDITSEDFDALKQKGGIKCPTDGDIKYLTQELNQTQTQTLIDYMYQTVLDICGMPNRNGGSSTSDTGAAVIMRDGWSSAEARAKDTEKMFKLSEKRFLKIAIEIVNTFHDINLELSDFDIHFTRRNYENIQMKSQVLTTMLNNSKIHPLLAFEHCGMFVDPEAAYMMSKGYEEAERRQKESELLAYTNSRIESAKDYGEDTA